ncbi:MAG TPA: CHAT domain-containing tetratricopeptide repeat protein [Blastocatellia bacterium]|nr:CHAT domain-containing tetratricopeptide repeat protein [Blastocatellia bacterium]
MGRTLGRLSQQPARSSRDAGAKVDSEKETRLLEPGKTIKRELAGDDSHTYQIWLKAGQFLNVVVEQQGVDVVARLAGPGEQIAEFDSERLSQEEESVPFVAEAEGVYRLTVLPRLKSFPAGSYEIRIEELRAATENDRALHEARKLLQEGLKLLGAGKYGEALPLVERSREIRERLLGPEHSDVAEALRSLGKLYKGIGDYAKAEPFYKRALAILEKVQGLEHPGVATVVDDLAMLYLYKGEYEKSELLHQRALSVREKVLGPEHPDVATSLHNLAGLHYERGEYLKAESLFQRAIEIREKVLGLDHIEVASSLNNLATVYTHIGNYTKAESLLRRGLEIEERRLGPDHPEIAHTLTNFAFYYRERGAYTQAETLCLRALALNEKSLGPDHPNVAASLYNLADLYFEKGDYAKAEQLYQRSLAIREKSLGTDHRYFASTLNNLAEIYFKRGDFEQAERIFQRALAIRERILGPDHPDVAISLSNLAILYRDRGDFVKAESLIQRALAIREKSLGPDHPDVARSINSLAVLYRDKGKYAEAEPLFRRALAVMEKALGPDHPYFASTLDDLAMLYALKGDLAKAVTVQARANSVSERNLAINLTRGSERQKLAYLAIFSEQTDFTLSLPSRALSQDRQALDLAFTTLLRRKGRGLDSMADTIGALRRHASPEDRALFDQLADARSQLAVFMFKELGTDEPEAYRARLKSLEDKVEELESALSARLPDFRAQAQPVTLTAVQSALPAEGALVEFAVYTPQDPRNDKNKLPPRYLAYLLTAHGRPKWVDLGEAAPIDRAITSWRHALCNPRRRDVKRLARAVDEKVMRPALALAQSRPGDIRRLLIAPDGLLNLIPFAALVDRQGRYLVERYSISYLASGRDLLRAPVRRPVEQDVVIVADPDYGSRGDAVMAGSRDVGLPPDLSQIADPNFNASRLYFPPLRGTAGEARALKSILPRATVFAREQATEAALKHLHGPSVLHVATHGFFLQDQDLELVGGRNVKEATVRSVGRSDHLVENPLLRSGLALAGVNQRLGRADNGDDGVLTALEAAGLDLWGTKLVALSACDTGVGEVKNGEGVFGLRRALALAGSETQVMSLWPVSDLGARDFMIEYYKALSRGDGRGDGLRNVQLEMLKRIRRRHPFYWASFIQSGEWANLAGKR